MSRSRDVANIITVAPSIYTTDAGTETLTNKTLTSPVLNTPSVNDALNYNPYIQAPKEGVQVYGSAVSSTQNIDLSVGSVHYFNSDASANWTFNIRFNESTSLNSKLDTGQSISLVALIQNGGTAYYQTGFQIDGNSVTPEWQGGSAPTSGNINSIDVYSFTIIKTADATFTALASQTQFA